MTGSGVGPVLLPKLHGGERIINKYHITDRSEYHSYSPSLIHTIPIAQDNAGFAAFENLPLELCVSSNVRLWLRRTPLGRIDGLLRRLNHIRGKY